MRRFLYVLPALLLAASVGAQQTKILPVSGAQPDGNSSSVYPTGYGGGRAQQIYLAGAITKSTAILREVRWRIDASAVNHAGVNFPNFSFWISQTSVSPQQMSATFASNRTGTPQLVFSGTMNMPAQGTQQVFNIAWKLATPFVFQPSQGHLLLEWEIAQASYKPNYFIDAHREASTPGNFQAFGTGGAFSSPESYSAVADLGRLQPGGTMIFEAQGFSQQYPGIVAFGFSNASYGPLQLPFDMTPLGAPGNSLYVSLDLLLPATWRSAGGAQTASASFPIPNLPGLDGFTMYAQGMFVDLQANAFGIVMSPGVRITLPIAAPSCSLLGSYDYQATTGSLSTGMGMVTEFSGVLP